jgi:O-antigen ligase
LYFQQYSNRFGLFPRQEDRQAHSLYLELFAERGVVGVLAFLGLCAVAICRGVTAAISLARRGRRDEAQVVQALLLGLCAYLTFAIVLHRAYEHYFWLLLGLVLGVAQAAAHGMRHGSVVGSGRGDPVSA